MWVWRVVSIFLWFWSARWVGKTGQAVPLTEFHLGLVLAWEYHMSLAVGQTHFFSECKGRIMGLHFFKV